MIADWATMPTSIGPFTVVTDPDSNVLASGWTADTGKLLPIVHPSLRPSELRERAELGPITRAVERYHAGELSAIDDIAVRQMSGPFLMHAWTMLRTVPAGKPMTYTEFAALSGKPDAVRAAAGACARNAAALFVPCHRIYRVDGTLGGFRWGLPVKRRLLDHEDPTR
jgi:methylated-DNA-[protein]-cysteine S-methyltransferase